MARSLSRQRDKLLARAESIRSSITSAVVVPLSQQMAALQSQLQALSDATDDLSRRPVTGREAADRSAAAVTARRDAPVVFLHVPKTAGTTVTIWLRLLYGDLYSKAASYSTEPEKVHSLAAALRDRPGTIEMVAGHLPYATRALFPERSRFFTFLREPVERALSHFSYFREREPIGAPSEPAVSLDEALATWDASSPVSQGLLPDNLQTRMLSGFELDAPASPAMLEAAKRHLRELDVVGLTERFDESVSLLHHVYGWKLLAIPSRRVRTHKRPTADALEPAVLDGLRRLNALDEELYADGADLFRTAWAQAGPTVSRDAEALQVVKQRGATGNGVPAPVSEAVASRAAEIEADTAAALDADLLEQAHGIAMTLLPHTTHAGEALGAHVQEIVQLTRRLTELVKKQHARM